MIDGTGAPGAGPLLEGQRPRLGAEPHQATGEPPLCVDLDGTLVAVDTLHYSLLQLVARRPWACGDLPWLAFQGRSHFKKRVSDRICISPDRLPYRPAVLAYVAQERARGRRVVLATAADSRIADAVAEHLRLFDDVLATRPGDNLKGARKRDVIMNRVSVRFDYMGDSMADLPIFAAARLAILVQPSRRLLAAVRRRGIAVHILPL
jgi:hypothetical protein